MSIRGSELDDDICFFCSEWCSTKNHSSDRYMCLQGSFKGEEFNNEADIKLLYVCDPCYEENNFEDDDVIELGDGKEFVIDSINRMND